MESRLHDHGRRTVRSIFLAFVASILTFALAIPPSAYAVPDESTLDFFYQNGIYYYDPSAEDCDPNSVAGATSSKPAGDKITWIGDQYTVNAESIIKSRLTGVDIHAKDGRSIQETKGGVSPGLTVLSNLKTQNKIRDYVVFALGLNDKGNDKVEDAINEIVSNYLSHDQTLILVTVRTKNTSYDKVNKQLKNVAKAHDNVIVADWDAIAKEHTSEYFDSEGSEPNTVGYKAWVDTIYSALPGGVGTLSGNGNEEKVWNYFATANIAGVSDNAAVIAGIMGNLQQESGFDPFITNKSGKYHGIYQTDNSDFIKTAEDAAGGSYWHVTGTPSTAPQEAIDKALVAELNWLTQKNESWLGTGWATAFGFVTHLRNVSTDTPEAYSDLFLMAVEREHGSTSGDNALQDPGVIELGTANFASQDGGGRYYQDAQKRRTNAKRIFDQYSRQAIGAYILDSNEFIAPVDQNLVASTTPVQRAVIAANDGGSQIATKAAKLEDYQKKFVEDHYQTAQQLSVAYGIPWETVVAQGIIESDSGRSRLAIDKHNYFGIGAYDSCPYECAKSYGSETEGWQGYYENIRKTNTYRNHGVFAGNTITDPMAYLVAIKAAGYATDPNYISTISKVILAIQEMSTANGWMSSADLAQRNPEMLTNAQKYAAGAGAAPSNLGGSLEACVNPSAASYSNYDGSGFPFYSQFDPQWSGIPWGPGTGACGTGSNNSSIGKSGCGPSSFAMMATALTGKVITPAMTAKVAGDAGCHVSAGSSWKVTEVLAKEYGLQFKDLAASSKDQAIQKINEALKDGWMIHTSGKGSSPFTSGGHYIGIRGITADGQWLIADSNGTKGQENTLNKAFSPESVVNAGMHISNIKAIKK